MTLQDILHSCGMSARPEYYSGRGATLSDLNSSILTKIHDKIDAAIGATAAENFTRMVAEMPKLSATAFLQGLHALESREWQWSKEIADYVSHIDFPSGDEGRLAIGMMTVVGVFSGMAGRNETPAIRGEFLLTVGPRYNIAPPKRIIESDDGGSYFVWG